MQSTHTKRRIVMAWMGLALLGVLLSACAGPSSTAPQRPTASAMGSFKIVGIGPGDGDLMTVRAVTVISNADVVFCSSKTREKLSPYVDFCGKQVLDGYGVLFRFYGRDCSQVKERNGCSLFRVGSQLIDLPH